MKKLVGSLLISLCVITGATAWAAPAITTVEVEGNNTVVASHILNALQMKAGEDLDQEKVSADVRRIYEMGYFSNADAKVSVNDKGGLTLTYVVVENDPIKEIRFEGNTIYKEKELQSLLFSQPGMVFNGVFFRNDMQRLRDRFQKDGYVMTRIKDVKVEQGIVTVQLGEARVGDVVIQGNRRTKTYVIQRYFPIKTGDLFNATTLRHSLSRLRNLGFLEDVNVGFEPSENDPDEVHLIVTVVEKKSASLLFSVSYGSSSGFGGGVAYKESNLGGRARVLDAGFDLGEYSRYWITLSDPYMDRKNFSWKIGAYRHEDKELTYRRQRVNVFKYDERRLGGFIGLGRKFGRDEQYSWNLTLDWHKSEIDTHKYKDSNLKDYGITEAQIEKHYISQDALNTKVFSATLELNRNTLDRYLPYPKGDRQTLGIEKAFKMLGGEWDYTKYWLEGAYYTPIRGIENFIELGITEDSPVIFAARVRGGYSSGNVPFSERYSLGGASTIRGYESGYHRGDAMVLGNVELRVPIDKNISFVAFYDIGKTWMRGSSFSDTPWMKSPGIGIRLKTPLGNVRVDVARGDDETEFHFGFGEMF